MKKKYNFFYIIFTFISSCNSIKSDESSENKIDQSGKIVIPTNIKESGAAFNIKGCSFDKELKNDEIRIFLPRNKEIDQIKNITSFSGLPLNFDIYSASIQNAVATIVDDKRYILYDPALLDYTDVNSDSYWASMSILAHEVGHHLSGHTLLNIGSNHISELEADKFSGFVLFKMGATLSQAKAAMLLIADEIDSRTHPSKKKRLSAIESGWTEASIQRYESAVPPPPSNDKTLGLNGYFKREFLKEDILSENVLNATNYGQFLNDNDIPNLEGIIVDVLNEDPTGGARAEYFEEANEGLNKVITIQFTKVENTDASKNRKVGNRETFHLLDYFQMSNVDRKCLETILVPGRKIGFKPFYFGYDADDIVYFIKLER
jgi:hypothetical protein